MRNSRLNKSSSIEIIDITNKPEYKHLLVGCIFHRKKEIQLQELINGNPERVRYLESAIPKGLHTKILFWKGDYAGMIEYGPPEAAGLPISGENIIIMNCIWIHRKVQGQSFGKMLIDDVIKSEEQAGGFATLALEDYWMVWIQKWMIEHLGFRSIDSIKLKHKTYKKGQCFKVHLMWRPISDNVTPPTWNKFQLLYGINYCHHHPIYWGKYGCAKSGLTEIHEKC